MNIFCNVSIFIFFLSVIFRRILEENYFGTEKEISEVSAAVLKYGSETKNIVEILVQFIRKLAEKHTLTWPPGLVPIYVELFECMRYVAARSGLV